MGDTLLLSSSKADDANSVGNDSSDMEASQPAVIDISDDGQDQTDEENAEAELGIFNYILWTCAQY